MKWCTHKFLEREKCQGLQQQIFFTLHSVAQNQRGEQELDDGWSETPSGDPKLNFLCFDPHFFGLALALYVPLV
jgi:hypothetical protein